METHDDPSAAPAPLPDPQLAGRAAAPRLRASWRRSHDYGVTPDEVIPVFTGTVDTDSLLYECAHRVLTDLQATIANEPVSLMVADSEGLVLARLGLSSVQELPPLAPLLPDIDAIDDLDG